MVELFQVKHDIVKGKIMQIGISMACFAVNEKNISGSDLPIVPRKNVPAAAASHENQFGAFVTV